MVGDALMTRLNMKSVCVAWACAVLPSIGLAADQVFYSIVGPDGRMMIVERPAVARKKVVAPSVQPTQPLATAQPTAQPTAQANVKMIEGERYIDSEYLEQREFNVEGRKRFYAVPDENGRLVNIEREKGVNLSTVTPAVAPSELVALAKNYQRIPAGELQQLIGKQCMDAKYTKQAKKIANEPVDFWPRPSFTPTFDSVIAELVANTRDVRVLSYASGSRRPTFYWPLPIFLDQQGCIIEGVMSYQQTRIDATILQQAALSGTLHIPQGARYLLMTPLAEAADLPNVQLSERGQLRLVPLRQSTQP